VGPNGGATNSGERWLHRAATSQKQQPIGALIRRFDVRDPPCAIALRFTNRPTVLGSLIMVPAYTVGEAGTPRPKENALTGVKGLAAP